MPDRFASLSQPQQVGGGARFTPASFGAGSLLRMPTLLLIEDSRFASEVLRLYARSLGLRLRRAADLETAATHLRGYTPDIMIVDLGLPDGRGEGLIEHVARAPQRPALLIATSGQANLAAGAMAAGADMFIEKPLPDIANFRALLVDHYPGALPLFLLPDHAPIAHPDRLALQDDLSYAARTLARGAAQGQIDAQYVAGLIDGIAGSLGDGALQQAARVQLNSSATEPSFHRLRDLVNERLRDVLTEREI